MAWIEALLGLACPGCGGALDVPGLCSSCRRALRAGRRGRFVFLGPYARWGGVARALKYRGKRDVLALVAPELARAVRQTGWELDGVTAVPTLFWRRLARGYNQAELLARALAGALELPYAAVLVRTRYTPSQTRRDLRTRAQLPQDVFRAVRPVSGSWLLVDDVYTSGATFRRAAEALVRAGAERVYGAFIAVRDAAWLP